MKIEVAVTGWVLFVLVVPVTALLSIVYKLVEPISRAPLHSAHTLSCKLDEF